jgi:hypothetical protein
MKSSHNPLKAKCCKGEKGVQWIPQYVGHRSAIRAPDVKTREDAQPKVCQPKKADGDLDSDGHLLVDCMKDYHEAGKKQVYGEVEEGRGYLDRKTHFVYLRTKEQK